MSPGIERDVDEVGLQLAPSRLRVAQALQGVPPVAVHEEVRFGEPSFEDLAIVVVSQVESGAALAQVDLRGDAGLVPVGRIDTQDVGAESGEQARGHRAGQHPRQVEHADAVERLRRRNVSGHRAGR